MSNADVPIWEKYTLMNEEASKYFRIGGNKLRKMAEENPRCGLADFKRQPYLDQAEAV